MIFQNKDRIKLDQEFKESQLDLLESLVDEGLIIKADGFFEIPNSNFYQLDQFTKQWLDIPKEFEGIARVRLDGPGLLFDESTLQIDFYNKEGKLEDLKVNGNFLQEDLQNKYAIPEQMFESIAKVSEYNSLQSKKENNQGFAKFAQLKKTCTGKEVILDDLLLNQEVVYPEALKLKVEVSEIDDTVTISPVIEGEEEFTDQFERRTRIKDQYSYRKEDGVKTRVLFGDKNMLVYDELEKIKRKSVYKGEEIKALVEQSSQMFNSDLLDLSELFGERVLGLEVFLPPSLTVINKINSDWVPGFKVSDEYIFVNDSYEYNLLQNSYQIAIEGEQKTVYFKGKTFGIESVKSVLRVSKLIFQDKVQLSESELEEGFKEFLIVKDNLEELSYTTLSDEEVIKNYTLRKAAGFHSEFQLKEHQIEGIAWLQATYFQLKAPGVLLADDMGLGKTLQILYFLESLTSIKAVEKLPALIVCPSSLIENWMQEYERFFPNPSFEVIVLKGNVMSYLQEIRNAKVNDCQPICITTYETMRINAVGFCAVNWGVIALDEVQKVKNPTALVTHTAKGLKANFKIAMTGTPVENSLLDLWCLMDLCVPGILGSAKLFNRNVQSEELNSEGIREIISTKFLRRLKSDVAKDLPTKHEHFFKEEFSGRQLMMYMNVLNQLTYLKENDLLKGAAMLTAIHEMKSIADHAELVCSDNDLNLQEVEDAAKIRIILRLLIDIKAKEEKVIVFTEKRKMQFILQQVFKNRFGLNADIVNGNVPSTSNFNDSKMTRQKLVDKFQSVNGFNVIIMSPIAAGFGLNVVGANHVIHYSRHWNPAKEQQATDRVYRIGQKKDVHIYYPIATLPEGTKSFDEILDDRLRRKKELSDDVMFPSEKIVVTNEEILNELI